MPENMDLLARIERAIDEYARAYVDAVEHVHTEHTGSYQQVADDCRQAALRLVRAAVAAAEQRGKR